MTLKDLRVSKGLSQAACAAYLGMSTRNYQNYENDPKKATTAKYNAIYQKLEAYGRETPISADVSMAGNFHTNVITGVGLQALVRGVVKFKKRDCFETLRQFVTRDIDGKICILYGLRRTGKTTLMLQMISELATEQTAYIKVKTTDNMSKLSKDLEVLRKNGCKYVFIDEITLMEDFINTAAILSDIYAMMGMKPTEHSSPAPSPDLPTVPAFCCQ